MGILWLGLGRRKMLGKIKARGALGMVGWQDIIASEKAVKKAMEMYVDPLHRRIMRMYFVSLLALHMTTRLEKEKG